MKRPLIPVDFQGKPALNSPKPTKLLRIKKVAEYQKERADNLRWLIISRLDINANSDSIRCTIRQLWKPTKVRGEIEQMLNVPPALGALSRRLNRGQRSSVNKNGDPIGELHSKGRFIVGIGSIHKSGTRYTLKGRVNLPWSKKGLDNVKDLELYEKKESKPKPLSKEVQYFQKREKLEAKASKELEKISQYYRTKPGRSTVNDEIIKELVKQLNGEDELVRDNKYYSFEPLYIDYRAYKLV
ncbi:12061_t:CDS:2 [Funneliformis geosporum]|uniref:12061_t:CDS:1 n=1 Tax=Funneliformis geosporum TaxID=1117311 RepID=A0A9W4SLE0_9GLOM|nr:12061_t:CDS:2 [Funneliformis geosporum]